MELNYSIEIYVRYLHTKFKLKYNLKEFHILTDIDDTIFPVGDSHMKLAGEDHCGKLGKLYPGIKEFYRTMYNDLELYPKNKNYLKYSTILSATPKILKKERLNNPKKNEQLIEALTISRCPKYGFLEGSLKLGDGLLTSINIGLARYTNGILGSYNGYAKNKVQRFMQYRTLFPEYNFCFIGDNGQGDITAGLKMIEIECEEERKVNGPKSTIMVCIHNVCNDKTK